jgi:hypothetical protein
MANIVYCNDKNCLKNNYYFALSTTPACNPTQLPPSHTGIADSGASGIYFVPGAPVSNLDHKAPTVGVHIANGLPERSIASATLASAPSLPPSAMRGHVMPSFPHTLIGLGPFADLDCQIVFTKTAVSVIHPDRHSILEGWREQDGPHLWQFPLNPTKPSLSVAVLSETYEEMGNFFIVPSRKQKKVSRPPSLPVPFLPRLRPATTPSLSVPLPEKHEENGPTRKCCRFFQTASCSPTSHHAFAGSPAGCNSHASHPSQPMHPCN